MNGLTDLMHPSPAPHFRTFQVLFLIYVPKRPGYSTTQNYVKIQQFASFFFKFKSNLQVKRVFLSTAPFAVANPDLISRVHCIIGYHATQIVEICHILLLHTTGNLKPNKSNTTGQLRP